MVHCVTDEDKDEFLLYYVQDKSRLLISSNRSITDFGSGVLRDISTNKT